MQQIKKDAIITFVKNKNKGDKEFALDDEIFSIPYSKIIKAEEFCKREDLEYCYLGFKEFVWHIGLETIDMSPIIKITTTGLATEVTDEYIIEITEV